MQIRRRKEANFNRKVLEIIGNYKAEGRDKPIERANHQEVRVAECEVGGAQSQLKQTEIGDTEVQ